MNYPVNFEEKIEFDHIRDFLKSYCLTSLGIDKLDKMIFLKDIELITLKIKQTIEFVNILKN